MADAVKWTDEQKEAIKAGVSNILVSAAAGSGKTAVLTERLLRRLTDENHPDDLSRMLIVTFTIKAAGELRDKIRRKLEEAIAADGGQSRLNDQLVKLPSAKISTIHSFCYHAVSSNFSLLGLPAGMTVDEGNEIGRIEKEVMTSIIDEFSAKHPAFASLCRTLASVNEEEKVLSPLLSLYDSILSFPDPFSLFDSFTASTKGIDAENFSDSVWWDRFSDAFSPLLDHASLFCRSVLDDIPDADTKNAAIVAGNYRAFLACVEDAKAALKAKNYPLLLKFPDSFPRAAALKNASDPALIEDKERLSDFKKKFKANCQKLLAYPPESFARSFEETAEKIALLGAFYQEFDSAFAEEKKRRRLLSFSDLEQYTYRLFVGPDGKPTEAAKETAQSFDHIFIDEYQDTNPVQDAIFAAISNGNNRFMVGDVKQSIYAFRGADPTIFESYRTNAGFRQIGLADNFRSESRVIEFVNTVFDRVFEVNRDHFRYDPTKDALRCNADPEKDDRTPVRIVGTDSPSHTALFLAEEIRRLIEAGEKPEDIAVLYRGLGREDSQSHKTVRELVSLLDGFGISHTPVTSAKFFDKPEIMLVIDLLTVIDNPRRDIRLIGALMSPIFGFSGDDLALIRQAEENVPLFDALIACEEPSIQAKKEAFLAFAEKYRVLAATLPADRLLFSLYHELNLLSYGRKSLMKLYHLSLSFPTAGYRGLYSFLEYLRPLLSSSENLPPVLDESRTDGREVNLMTIHKSKGLEFRNVFLIDCEKKFRRESDSLLFDRGGMALLLEGEEKYTTRTSFPYLMMKSVRDATETEEEHRLFYTALTRAKKRLVLTFIDKKLGETEWKKPMLPLTKFALREANSYLKILQSVLDFNALPPCCVYEEFLPDEETKEDRETPEAEQTEKVEKPAPILPDFAKEKEILEKRFAFVYPHPTGIPAKVSVSRLYPDLLEESDDAASLEKEEDDTSFSLSPVFLSGEKTDAAKKGSATHLFMQFCDFASVRISGTDAEIARLTEKGFLQKKDAALVDRKALAVFFRSDLFGQMAKATFLRREQRFNIFLPASMFVREEKEKYQNDEILVQGVVDCLFEDENGLTLVDYKTDRVFGEEGEKTLIERHSLQLRYYAEAIFRILGRKVTRAVLYSFSLGKTVEIPLAEE